MHAHAAVRRRDGTLAGGGSDIARPRVVPLKQCVALAVRLFSAAPHGATLRVLVALAERLDVDQDVLVRALGCEQQLDFTDKTELRPDQLASAEAALVCASSLTALDAQHLLLFIVQQFRAERQHFRQAMHRALRAADSGQRGASRGAWLPVRPSRSHPAVEPRRARIA